MRRLVCLLFLIAIPLQAASRLPVREAHVMVASVDAIASRVGADIMKRGGNAVDAAVAVTLTLGGTRPEAGNLCGGGFPPLPTAHATHETLSHPPRAPLATPRH